MTGTRPTGGSGDPITILGLQFGRFPEADSLHPRFLPDHERMRLTLEISPGIPLPSPSAMLADMERIFPGLRRHRCGGDRPLGAWSADDTAGPDDPRTGIAHLIEHLIIDIQHFVADMRRCSGVTCAFRSPAHRFDIFIESPGRDISRLGVALACATTSSLVLGRPPDPVFPSAARLARAVTRHPLQPITSIVARDWLDQERRSPDDPDIDGALHVLHAQGFVEKFDACVDFSGVPLYHAVSGGPAEPPRHAMPGPLNLDLSSP